MEHYIQSSIVHLRNTWQGIQGRRTKLPVYAVVKSQVISNSHLELQEQTRQKGGRQTGTGSFYRNFGINTQIQTKRSQKINKKYQDFYCQVELIQGLLLGFAVLTHLAAFVEQGYQQIKRTKFIAEKTANKFVETQGVQTKTVSEKSQISNRKLD